jgi:hypothetical protein
VRIDNNYNHKQQNEYLQQNVNQILKEASKPINNLDIKQKQNPYKDFLNNKTWQVFLESSNGFDERAVDDVKKILFENKKGNRVFPPFATAIRFNNNIKANKTKTIIYEVPKLKKGDIVISQWVSYIIRPSLAKALKIANKEITKKILGHKTEIIIQN